MVVGRSARHPEIRVGSAELDLGVPLHFRCDSRDRGSVTFHGDRVLHLHLRIATAPRAPEPGLTGTDGEDVRTQLLDLLLNRFLRACSERDHRDYGRYADHDSEHRQHASQLVRGDRLEGNANDLTE